MYQNTSSNFDIIFHSKTFEETKIYLNKRSKIYFISYLISIVNIVILIYKYCDHNNKINSK